MSSLEPIRADLENVRLANVRLAIIRRRHPDWQIGGENGAYTALSRPAPTSEHFVVRRTLTELDDRLNKLDGR